MTEIEFTTESIFETILKCQPKVELITNIIHLVLINKWIHICRTFYSDEIANDEKKVIDSTIFV